MLLNPSKCHYMSLGSKTEKDEFSFNGKFFENGKEETILGVTIENKLTICNQFL